MSDQSIPSKWMTAAQAAKYLQRGRRFILREIHKGNLRAARVGGRGEILTTADWCDAYVESRLQPVDVYRRRA